MHLAGQQLAKPFTWHELKIKVISELYRSALRIIKTGRWRWQSTLAQHAGML